MAQAVVENVRQLDPLGFAYVATQEWVGKTKGAIDTILKAFVRMEYAHGKDIRQQPLVVANCDQLVKLPEDVGMPGNGIVFTFRSSNTAHSYVVTDRKDRISSIVEKPESPPSDRAVSGVYYFPIADPFLKACAYRNKTEKGEQYVSSALEHMIASGYTLYAVDAPTAILGTPEDFQRFETAMRFAPRCSGGCSGCAC